MLGLGQLIDWYDRWRQRRTDVQVRVHRALLLQPAEEECYFINVWNASPERDVTVTHVWLETEPSIHVMTKRLPVRIAARSQWETFVAIEALPSGLSDEEVFHLARVKLADDRVIKSVPRENVPPVGFVPSG